LAWDRRRDQCDHATWFGADRVRAVIGLLTAAAYRLNGFSSNTDRQMKIRIKN
jgi:hypothetical protein